MNALETYRTLFPESAIPDSTLERLLGSGYTWTAEGALYDPCRPPRSLRRAPNERSKPLTAAVGELLVEQLGREALQGRKSVSMGNLINDCVQFDIRDHETKLRTERVQAKDGSWHNIPAALPNFGELAITHGAQWEIEPMTGEELVALLRHFYGADIFVRMNLKAMQDTNHCDDSLEWRAAMDQQTHILLCELLQDLDNLIEVEREEEAAARAKAIREAQGRQEKARARTRRVFWRLTSLWRFTQTYLEWHISMDKDRDATRHEAERMEEEAIELVVRLRRCFDSDFFDPPWAYEDRYSLGHSDGLTDDLPTQIDAALGPLEQFSEEDGDLLAILEVTKSWKGSRASMACYDEAFYRGGEVIGTDDKGEDIHAVAGDPRPFSERNLYYRRCSHDSEQRFATMLWRICTYPLETVQHQFASEHNTVARKYTQSVKANKPGPGRSQRIELLIAAAQQGNTNAARIVQDVRQLGFAKPGQTFGWVNTPLYGMPAVNWIKENVSLETRRGKHINVTNIRVVKFPTWHKLWITGEQKRILDAAVAWRLGANADLACAKTTVMLNIAATLALANAAVFAGGHRACVYQLKRLLAKTLRELKYNAQQYKGVSPSFFTTISCPPLAKRQEEVTTQQARLAAVVSVREGALDCVQSLGEKLPATQTMGEKLPSELATKRSAAAKKGWETRRRRAAERAAQKE